MVSPLVDRVRPRARRALATLAALTALCALLPLTGDAIPAGATPPPAADLLAQPYQTTGVRVQMTGFGNLRGLATDGTSVFALDTAGNIGVVPYSSITMTPGGSVTVAATMHTVGWGVNGAPSRPDLSNLSLAASHGCLWITNDSNTVGQIKLYCIDTTTFEVSEVAVPGAKPLPAGAYYVRSSVIDFPDGRVGKVSAYESDGSGGYLSTLRTYTVTGTGSAANIAWSTDYQMADPVNWATDEHGIATDGTYLYRIQWNSFVPNTKVWALTTGTPAAIVTSSQYTMPYGNMHFLAHNHVANFYLVGHWDQPNFFITTAADPGPGPGNPLVPTFGTVTPTADGYTVQITNYDAAFTWGGTATSGGTVSIDGSGLMTVSGVAASTASTATVATTRTGYPGGSAPVTGTALAPPPTTTTTSTSTTTSTTTTTTSTTTTTTTTAPPTTTTIAPPTTTSTVPATTTTSAPTTVPPTTSAPPTAPTPVPLPNGSLPELEQRSSVVMVDGVPVPGTVDARPGAAGATVSGDGFTMSIAGTDAEGTPVRLGASGRLVLTAGRSARVQGRGFAAGTAVDAWLFSEPRYLGRIMVGADGSFDETLPIPADVVAGDHTVQANGTTVDGRHRSVSLGVEVATAAPAPGRELAFTGSETAPHTRIGVALVGLGMLLVLTRGRRRQRRSQTDRQGQGQGQG